jgi:hypothetical protein
MTVKTEATWIVGGQGATIVRRAEEPSLQNLAHEAGAAAVLFLRRRRAT